MGIQIPADYRPQENEPFMNERQREYFRRKLNSWKEEILKESGISAQLMKPVKQSRLFDCLATVMSEEFTAFTESVAASIEKIEDLKQTHVRILVVEDNVVNQNVAAGLLASSFACPFGWAQSADDKSVVRLDPALDPGRCREVCLRGYHDLEVAVEEDKTLLFEVRAVASNSLERTSGSGKLKHIVDRRTRA